MSAKREKDGSRGGYREIDFARKETIRYKIICVFTMSVKLAGAWKALIPAEVPIFSAHQLMLSEYTKLKISISGYPAISYSIDYPRLY